MKAFFRSTTMLLSLTLAIACSSSGGGEDIGSDTNPLQVPILNKAVAAAVESFCHSDAQIVFCENFEDLLLSNGGTNYDSNVSTWSDGGVAVGGDWRPQDTIAFGGSTAMEMTYTQGEDTPAFIAWYFGDHPYAEKVRGSDSFSEVYMRFYHRFSDDTWPSYPPTLAGLRSHASGCGWCFAWLAPMFFDSNGILISDPLRRVAAPDGTSPIASNTPINQDDAWSWGPRSSSFDVTGGHGQWQAIEVRLKLNDEAQNTGNVVQQWVNGELVLDATSTNSAISGRTSPHVNLRGGYDATHINVALIDAQWLGGAPQTGLKRYFDNVVVSEAPIGCAEVSISKAALSGQVSWEVQIADDAAGTNVLWSSNTLVGGGLTVPVNESNGTFAGDPPCFVESGAYHMRARHADASGWSEWSAWETLF